jgi:hypothetical protein
MSTTELERLRHKRRHSAIFQGTVLSALTVFTVATGTVGVNSHLDLSEITEEERLSAMRGCMLDAAEKQINAQTDFARTGAIVVIDGGNPALAPCIDQKLESGENDDGESNENGNRFIGGMSALLGLIYTAMMANTMFKSMRRHNAGIREQREREERYNTRMRTPAP